MNVELSGQAEGVDHRLFKAALLHASWNDLVKANIDERLAMGAIVIGHVPIAVIILPFTTIPDSKSIPYLLTGVVLYFGYQLFLLKSYEHGDLTKFYPTR